MRTFNAFAAAALLLTATAAAASTSGPGYINSVVVLDNGVMLFNQDGARSALPSCNASSLATRWAINGATPAGQVQVSQILTAYSLHKQIVLVGNDTCAIWGDTESLQISQTIG